MADDEEADRFSARARRYANLGVSVGAFAARAGARRLIGGESADTARDLAQALGTLKGPLMKVAQMMATIPEALPADYAEQLISLQSQAPPMGAAFVRRRMQAELGPDWRARFAEFGLAPAAAASLGQVHRAKSPDGEGLACKLQYPDMASTVEVDIGQLEFLLKFHRRMGPAIDASEIAIEIAARLREELDYEREAKLTRLYGAMLADRPRVRTPAVFEALSTRRLLTQEWLEGEPVTRFDHAEAATRNAIALGLFEAWWRPFSRYGVIHGDPHLGNYSVVMRGPEDAREVEAINLYDYGCVRIFPPTFVSGVVDLYRGLADGDEGRVAHAYESWGFVNLSRATVDALNIWARFIYGPLIDDRVRTIADGVKPGEYGRREIATVMRALKAQGGALKVPREFVFMDRAAIGLGGAFLRLGAELNFHRLFEETIEGFEAAALAARQAEALERVALA
ncbi:MAG: AarF/UbiB family protein [Roseiarcus sp.]|jgi:predicted unusual protein kinase regulating ubiquinone biosynthesis (AarF/ABC1/UbiB family)